MCLVVDDDNVSFAAEGRLANTANHLVRRFLERAFLFPVVV